MPPTLLANISPPYQSASAMKDVLTASALAGYAAAKQMGMTPPPMPGAMPGASPLGAPPMPSAPLAMAGAPPPLASAAPPAGMTAPGPAAMPPGGAPAIDPSLPTPITDRYLPPAQPAAQPQGAMPAFAEGGVMGGVMPPEMPMNAEMGAGPAGAGMEPDMLMANVTPAADLFSAIARLKSGEHPDAIRSSLLGGGEMETGKPEGALEPAPDVFLQWLSQQDEPANEVVQDLVEAYAADPSIADQLWSAVKAAIADPEERKELPRDLLALASKAGSAPSAKKPMRPAAPMTETLSAPPMPKGKVA